MLNSLPELVGEQLVSSLLFGLHGVLMVRQGVYFLVLTCCLGVTLVGHSDCVIGGVLL